MNKMRTYMSHDTLKQPWENVSRDGKFYGQTTDSTTVGEVKDFLKNISVTNEFMEDEIKTFI
jgi:hypothetical protein